MDGFGKGPVEVFEEMRRRISELEDGLKVIKEYAQKQSFLMAMDPIVSYIDELLNNPDITV